MTKETILITGATGYIGGRLVKVLEARGCRLRCLARQPEFLRPKLKLDTEIFPGDVLDSSTLAPAFMGTDVVYYLVHSMGAGPAFEEKDRMAARNVAEAARRAGVGRIVYLGGLGDSRQPLSPHLRSRHEVGEILRASGAQVIEFRASIVLGSGSLSFEMIRALVERLPVMTTPRWVSVPAQPIAITDLLDYLVQALEFPSNESRIFEIGGADQVSYGDLMREYACQKGLRRLMIPVPVLTPWLSSLWLGLVTPLYARVGRILIESIRYPTVVRDDQALKVFSIRPRGMREALSNAIRNEDQEFAQTRWSDALSSSGLKPKWGGVRMGNRLVDSRTVSVPVSPKAAFHPIQRIGGTMGWYYANWLWQLRGFLDLLVGGAGMRRGRGHPENIQVGGVIDCWRVEAFEPARFLRLIAEMKLPGRAWLEFEVTESGRSSVIRQTAVFDPAGFSGLAYWYLLYPAHYFIFRGMLKGIARSCVRVELEDN